MVVEHDFRLLFRLLVVRVAIDLAVFAPLTTPTSRGVLVVILLSASKQLVSLGLQLFWVGSLLSDERSLSSKSGHSVLKNSHAAGGVLFDPLPTTVLVHTVHKDYI